MEYLWIAALLAGAVALPALQRRVLLARAKHPSLQGHPRLARVLARLLPSWEYDDGRFFRADAAPDHVEALRRAGFERLAEHFRSRCAQTRRLTAEAAPLLSDLQFTGAHRVPFPFRARVGRDLGSGAFVRASSGVEVEDLDGNRWHDLSGSYGVNLFGYDFYKQCLERGVAAVRDLGPVLGAYHPLVLDNARRLRALSGLDEVSFHMSGTEAILQAVRLARYHTRRPRLVRFCGAYHGFWDDVQPGWGNPRPARDTLTLRDVDERSLRALEARSDVACVLVNPLQALHPNAAAPGDSLLIGNGRRAAFDRAAYAAWLGRLRDVCTRRGIVLILDEIFVGFRLAPRGAQEYFDLRADLVTYGKSVGGGLPVGVLCGRRELMKRWRDERPGEFCFARGTFNSHPYVMGAMHAFLEALDTPAVRALYRDLDQRWDERAARLNARLLAQDLPVSVAHLSSIWTVLYARPSRYNWMFQYYLRAHGLALSWVGSGRLIFSLDHDEAAFERACTRFLAAARAFRDDGWAWADERHGARLLRRELLRATLAAGRRAWHRPAAATAPPAAHAAGLGASGSSRSPRSSRSGAWW